MCIKENGFKPRTYVHISTVYIAFSKIFSIEKKKKMKMIEGMEVTSEWLNFENKIVPGIK